ncbi:MAG: hypothetical protein KOO62_03400 [candidate division Zixibacteria bacterium]|nr:hypothetical protein [candidate division Zixibacteria bacterium]
MFDADGINTFAGKPDLHKACTDGAELLVTLYNDGMVTGSSGDVLRGTIGSFISTGDVGCRMRNIS